MTVKELITELQRLPQDAEIVQSDPEGNRYWRTGDVTYDCRFDFAAGHMRGLDLIDEDEEDGGGGVLAVVLWAGY